jgi:hypothetical protein
MFPLNPCSHATNLRIDIGRWSHLEHRIRSGSAYGRQSCLMALQRLLPATLPGNAQLRVNAGVKPWLIEQMKKWKFILGGMRSIRLSCTAACQIMMVRYTVTSTTWPTIEADILSLRYIDTYPQVQTHVHTRAGVVRSCGWVLKSVSALPV